MFVYWPFFFFFSSRDLVFISTFMLLCLELEKFSLFYDKKKPMSNMIPSEATNRFLVTRSMSAWISSRSRFKSRFFSISTRTVHPKKIVASWFRSGTLVVVPCLLGCFLCCFRQLCWQTFLCPWDAGRALRPNHVTRCTQLNFAPSTNFSDRLLRSVWMLALVTIISKAIWRNLTTIVEYGRGS